MSWFVSGVGKGLKHRIPGKRIHTHIGCWWWCDRLLTFASKYPYKSPFSNFFPKARDWSTWRTKRDRTRTRTVVVMNVMGLGSTRYPVISSRVSWTTTMVWRQMESRFRWGDESLWVRLSFKWVDSMSDRSILYLAIESKAKERGSDVVDDLRQEGPKIIRKKGQRNQWQLITLSCLLHAVKKDANQQTLSLPRRAYFYGGLIFWELSVSLILGEKRNLSGCNIDIWSSCLPRLQFPDIKAQDLILSVLQWCIVCDILKNVEDKRLGSGAKLRHPHGGICPNATPNWIIHCWGFGELESHQFINGRPLWLWEFDQIELFSLPFNHS